MHHQIFKLVYPWAGQLRRVDIGKGDTLFLPHTHIQLAAHRLFSGLAKDNYLQGLSHEELSQKLGAFLIGLNHIHPFREGNGRTQRLLVSRLTQQAGVLMDWSGVSNEAMKRACIEGIQGNRRPMGRLLLLNSRVL